MSLTQKDIARRLGVSPSLVSRALRGTASRIGAADETVQRIREEAKRLGYRSSAAALTLRGEPTQTLAVIVKDFEDPYFGQLIGQLQRVACAAGFSLVLTGRDAYQPEQVDIGTLWKYHVDGLIVVGSEFQPLGLEPFVASKKPVVQIGTGEQQAGLTRVCMDEACGLGRLLDYLMELGHREIGYLGDGTPANRRRRAVLQQEMRRRRLAIRNPWFVDATEPSPDDGASAVAQLLTEGAAGSLPTALVASDDVLAQSALRALFVQGYRVPQDISLAGVDDIPAARMTIPALTTIRQPLAAMVQEAFERVVQSGASTKRTISIEPELVVRESCGPPKGP